jgi:two-component sensor histidine kinase
MALIHAQLYADPRFDRIDLSKCIENLIEQLSRIYASDCTVDTRINPSEVHLNINQAIPCALVLNELISNAYKHAFSGRQRGRISISLEMDDENRVTLRVQDDGIGMPPDIELENCASLGLTLVKNLVNVQLGGGIGMTRRGGTGYAIRFDRRNDVSLCSP